MTDSVRIGIDLGGTKIEGIAVAAPVCASRVLARRRIPTEQDRGWEHLLDQVVELVGMLAADCGASGPLAVGVGMPGSVTRDGRVKNSNTVCLNGTRFRFELADRLPGPTVFANDANCFALAEATLGAGQGHGLVFGVILGTGVGGGIALDGAVREGPQSIAGEWGHMVLRPDSDRRCYCGQAGCVETYLAGPWIEKHYRDIAGHRLALPDILAQREAGEPRAAECVAVWLEHYGRALGNAINLLDPDIVVLGGGVSRADCLYGEGRQWVERFVFSDELLTPIVRHALGDSAGVFGAALLVA